MSLNMEISSFQLLNQAMTVVAISLLTVFLVNLYLVRMRIIKLKRQGLSMPPHHPVFGHLLLAKNTLLQTPQDMHPTYVPGLIKRAFPDIGPVFYLDMWPFAPPILVALSPFAASQFTRDHSLPKLDALRKFLKPLTKN